MVSERYRSADAMALIASHKERLPVYRRADPDDWSRKVQDAAFGVGAERVTQNEYDELINYIRKIREWLKDNGHDASEHQDFCGTDHRIFWDEKEVVGDNGEAQAISISVEPHAWEQQGARGLEHYPKFSLDDGRGISFSVYFDDTYELSVEQADSPRFNVDFLSRRVMTRMEYAIVRDALLKAAAVFEISLSDLKPEGESFSSFQASDLRQD